MAEANPNICKILKVTDEISNRTRMFPFKSYEIFHQKCKSAFKIDESVITFFDANNISVEMDEDCLGLLPNEFHLLLKRSDTPTQTSKKRSDTPTQTSKKIPPEGNKNMKKEKQQSESIPSTVHIESGEITVDKGEEVKKHINKYGLKGVDTVLKATLDNWKSKPLNIGVTGASGKGKTSLINALRDMSDTEAGAAEVGEVECTVKCRSYPFPGQDNFVLWDVPGVGTKSFPKETYLKDIDIDRFDFFMIVSTERFSEIDIWLAKEIIERDKRFYFIQTKMDVQMDNIRDREEAEFNEKNAFSTLKKKTAENLKKDFGSDQFILMMLSNKRRCRNKYDFPKLVYQLLTDVPREKEMALSFGVAALSRKVIESKASLLKSRIWKVALISGAGAAIPIPFVSNVIDAAIILEEILFLRKQLALDDDSLNKLAQSADMTLKYLKESVEFTTPAKIFTENGLAAYMAKHMAGEVAEKIVQYTLPVIGTVVACGWSYSLTMSTLESILKMMTTDAKSVLALLSKKQTSV